MAAAVLAAAIVGPGEAKAPAQTQVASTTAQQPQPTVGAAQDFLRTSAEQYGLSTAPGAATGDYVGFKRLRFEPYGDCLTSVFGDLEWRLGAQTNDPFLTPEDSLHEYKIAWMKARGLTAVTPDIVSYFDRLYLPPMIDWSMMPRIGTPPCSRATSVPNSGRPVMNDLVPSIGSRTQTNCEPPWQRISAR